MAVFSMECGSGNVSEPDPGDRDITDTIDLYTFDQSYSTLSTKFTKFMIGWVTKAPDGFCEVGLGFNEDQVIEEANRCLQCDLELSLAEEAKREKGILIT